ncbi:hypothetical protein HAX54_031298, partial [Datura stramonium]|nr:hypothetical protein [Datura stramonium]
YNKRSLFLLQQTRYGGPLLTVACPLRQDTPFLVKLAEQRTNRDIRSFGKH